MSRANQKQVHRCHRHWGRVVPVAVPAAAGTPTRFNFRSGVELPNAAIVKGGGETHKTKTGRRLGEPSVTLRLANQTSSKS